MKTYVISAKTGFGFNGIKLEPGDEIAVITTNVSPENLFGWLQFGQAEAILVSDDDSEELPISDADQVADNMLSEQPSTVGAACEEGGTPVAEPVTPEPQPETSAESEPELPQDPEPTTSDPDAFVADGLDEKIAAVLAGHNLTPDEVRQMLAAGFDLTELDGIGPARVDKIKAVYGD